MTVILKERDRQRGEATSGAEDHKTLRGQDFVRSLSKRALDLVRLTHEARTDYIDVDLKNQANAEDSAKRDYRGRFLFELLQNASDAIADARDQAEWQREGYRVRIELTTSALIVANDGVPFLEKDVDSIFRWGVTSKDPNKSIGYKGIGFKSVLEITEAPEIFSRVVQFRFDRKTCYSAIRKIVGHDSKLKLPITRFVFPYNIELLPVPDRELVRDLLQREGFATVIRLPLNANVGPSNVLERIDMDIDPALLLLLPGIDRIEIRMPERDVRVLDRIAVRSPDPDAGGQDLILRDNGEIVARWLLFDSPKRPIDDRSIIASLKDQTWERVRKVGFAVAFPLDIEGRLEVGRQEPEKIFVYFPTKERTGLRYRIHGDFYVDAARKQVDPIDYNLWLAVAVATFIRTTVIPALTQRFPAEPRIAQVLVSTGAGDKFGDALCKLIDDEIRKCPFVACADGDYETAGRIMFAPPGAAVDITTFARFFPFDELARRHGRRRFPSEQLEGDEKTVEFLVHLGAKRLAFEDVFALLDGRQAAQSSEEYTALYDFLWRWREDLAPAERRDFSGALQRTYCVVVDDNSWIISHGQVYHAKLRTDTPTMPRAVKAKVVHPSAYDTRGRDGPTYRLLDTLAPKIRDYDAPEIVRSAIMPLFEKGRFKDLSTEARQEVYLYLFRYWQSRRDAGDPDVERVKGQVQVPARYLGNRRRDVWLPANQVYLSSEWIDDDRLEDLYSGFDDVAFLYQVRGWELQPDEKKKWTRFWQWLGVSAVPRVLVDEKSQHQLARLSWPSVAHSHRHAGTKLWKDYLEELRASVGVCPRHGADYRRLSRSVTVEGYAELIARGDGQRLALLYQLLAENWSYLRNNIPSAQVQCYRQNCPQSTRSADAPSFFHYLARNGEWIAARTEITGQPSLKLYQPSQCWSISRSENPAIRNLLPTPILDSSNGEYRTFDKYIGIRAIDEANCEDLLDLLRRLPEQYPDPEITVSTGKKVVRHALAGLTRWTIGRINNILATGDVSPSTRQERIPIIAQQGDTLRYVMPPEPLFFANDRYYGTRWRSDLPFAPVEENWRDAARYLGLSFISEHVAESCASGEELEADSSRLEDYFKRARPYLLAMVNRQSPSVTADVARYLSSLHLSVVDTLVVHRRLTLPPERTIGDAEAKVYLDKSSDRRIGSSGRAPRSGQLYVRRDYQDNYDLLGGPIADYVGVPTLADAFVILLERGDKNGRMRYLDTQGVTTKDVEDMRAQLAALGAVEKPPPPVDDGALNDHLKDLLEQIGRQQLDTALIPLGGEPQPPVQPIGKSGGEGVEPIPDKFPEYNLDLIQPISVGRGEGFLRPAAPTSSRRGAGRRVHDWERDQRLREAYGKRGEDIVRRLELRRLGNLTDAPEDPVHWLREEGEAAADHDLESKDLIDGKWVDVVIEVKATPGCDFRFPMSREELACAQRVGEHYRLYRVINVASEAPEVFVFENPYSLWKGDRARIELRDTYVTLPDPRQQEPELSLTADQESTAQEA